MTDTDNNFDGYSIKDAIVLMFSKLEKADKEGHTYMYLFDIFINEMRGKLKKEAKYNSFYKAYIKEKTNKTRRTNK